MKVVIHTDTIGSEIIKAAERNADKKLRKSSLHYVLYIKKAIPSAYIHFRDKHLTEFK